MSRRKERLTVTVDAELVAAGSQAVAAGRAESLSGWVNDALVERRAREQRQHALTEAVAAYEAAHGALSGEEISAQRRADERAAVVVRGRAGSTGRPSRRRPRAA